MDPNFEDLSCEMKFGVPPPPLEQEKVYSQPCFTKQVRGGVDGRGRGRGSGM